MTASRLPESYLRAWHAWLDIDERAAVSLRTRLATAQLPAARAFDDLQRHLRTVGAHAIARPDGDHDAPAGDGLEALHHLEVSLAEPPSGVADDLEFQAWIAASRSLLQQCALLPWGETDEP